ncbi:MAG: O-methyltransferase [Phycisphaerales bacterium JB065]
MTTHDTDKTAVVDAYAVDHLLVDERLKASLDFAVAESAAAGLPDIRVSAMHGMQLMLLVRALGARNVLEIGTLGGYSTICLAAGLAGEGRILTLEVMAKHAAVARRNIEHAGYADRVEVREGDALASLEAMLDSGERGASGQAPFDFVFIDADKARIPEYLDASVRLSRPGGMIIVDNTVRDGRIVDAETNDESVQGVRRMYEMLKTDRRVMATAIQTVGAKGWDGYTMVVVV